MTQLRKGTVLLLVGTSKGGFIFRSDARRKKWSVEGPLFKGLIIHHFTFDPRDRETFFAAAFSDWWGGDIQRSRDGGRTWQRTNGGVRYDAESGLSVKCIWHIRPGRASEPGVAYAGVDPAGLFRSEDGGATWSEVKGLNRHETRSRWTPGKGGLILHSIVPDPRDAKRMHVGISAAGVFFTENGGATWQARNKGTRADFLPVKFPDLGQCVHKLLLAADGERLYQQNHCGVYRSDSAGQRWTDISKGLTSRFGFCMGVHPREPGTAWVVPITGAEFRACPDGKLTVFRSRDGGRSWQRSAKGLPDRNAHLLVLREAMSVDAADPAGVYFGTSTGQLFHTRDEGRAWHLLADFLPPVYSVEAFGPFD
jgi:photosystem II stability/assembly factor-like uncharacterized protein